MTVDKWSLLDTLARGAGAFGLTHRHLTVLKVLVSFHPQRHLPITARTLVVYPSNKTLSARLSGMPESTLRRNLAALVASGLIARRSSSNGKRFRRGHGVHEIAFGFDLAPLVDASARIRQAAAKAEEAAARCAALRAEILALRQDMRDVRGDTALTDDLARALRRKLDETELTALAEQARRATSETYKTSGRDHQNERHIDTQERKKDLTEPGLTPQWLTQRCVKTREFLPERMHTWRDVVRKGQELAPLLGIDDDILKRLSCRHGAVAAALCILAVMEDGGAIKVPSAYLMRMDEAGALPAALVTRLNTDCQLTTRISQQKQRLAEFCR